MGQGQADLAIQTVKECARNGEWLCLKNLHLVVPWLSILEKVRYCDFHPEGALGWHKLSQMCHKAILGDREAGRRTRDKSVRFGVGYWNQNGAGGRVEQHVGGLRVLPFIVVFLKSQMFLKNVV